MAVPNTTRAPTITVLSTLRNPETGNSEAQP